MGKKDLRIFLFGIIVIILGNFSNCSKNQISINGEMKKWHKVTLTFEGPESYELAKKNPFLDYRLEVVFTHEKSGEKYRVPGFFAADGRAANTGATKGNKWRAHFCPDETGMWNYEVIFLQGKDMAVSENTKGKELALHGSGGAFEISDTDKTGRDFRAKGKLQYTGGRYLQFAETGEYYLKGGADSPENFLAYSEFDDTYSLRSEEREGEAHSLKTKTYEPHIKDWENGDPTWKNGKGKGIIGALNYLASQDMNSVYFLTMNVQGDGQDVWPWINENERTRFDCSKLDQWEIVFSHMDKLGIMLHFVTQETENELLLDIGKVKTIRKLYYRELIARFGHHLGIIWNLGEENGVTDWSPKGQTDKDRKAMAMYIKELDPYDNFVVIHTHANPHHRNLYLEPLLGYPYLDGPSLQIYTPKDIHNVTKEWIKKSGETGKQWVVNLDEVGPAHTGVKPDADDPDHDKIRKNVLWGNLMAGGGGVEYYFGYKYAHNDLNCEDWRTRENMWEMTDYALGFFHEYIPFWKMESGDELVSGDNWCFADEGNLYLIYLPQGGSTDLKLKKGDYSIKWFNPRKGGELLTGSKEFVTEEDSTIGYPPEEQNKDWAVLIRKEK